MSEQPQPLKVPAKASYKVKVIVSKNNNDLEEETNKFLGTISDERRLINITFAVNMKTGELIHIIHYSDISPMTPKEFAEKQEKQKKFAQGFIPEDLMPNGVKVSKL